MDDLRVTGSLGRPIALGWRLYDQALPITEALESFAPTQVKEQFSVLDFGNALIQFPDRFWTRQRARFHNFGGLVSSLLPTALQFGSGGADLCRRQRAQLYQMELNYIHGLPQYVLLGFVTPRQVESVPVAIPLDCWEGEFDWEGLTLQAGSLAFEGLRIANLVTLPATLTAEWAGGAAAQPTVSVAAAPAVTTAKKRGPQSAQLPICQAVDELFANPEFRKAPQKRQLEMVLAIIRGRDPVLDAVLGKSADKTLKGHISRRLRELDSAGRPTTSIP